MAAFTTIDNPELYFQTVLYTGNGSAGNAITLDGSEDMQPDFVWIKQRDSRDHFLFNSVIGATKYVASNLTQTEQTDANTMTGFDSDGFTLGNGVGCNESDDTHVAWCWKAGTAFSNDASATSIGDVDSSGSAATIAGFSICSYTGSGTAGDTIKHGLDKAPEILLFKNRSTDITWIVGSKPAGFTNIQFLQTTAAATDDSNAFNDVDPGSSVFTLGGNLGTGTNETSSNFVCYAFASIQGYSKVDSYVGNGNNDGTFVYTGFKPAFVMIKKFSAAGTSWVIFDNKRNTFNERSKILQPNDSGGEETSANRIDFNSNGFKLRGTWTVINASGATYLYMAFAESPFVNSNGIPNNGE